MCSVSFIIETYRYKFLLFQKNNSNVYVLTEYNEHIIDLNTPWNAGKQLSVHVINDHEDISSISEIHGKMDLDLLICNLLIGGT